MATQTTKKTSTPQSNPTTSTTTGRNETRTTTRTDGPTAEQIARRAFELYQARGGTHGRDQDDWYQAERELKLGRQ